MKNLNVRKLFPAFAASHANKKLIYFDNACSLLKSAWVIQAVKEYYEHLGVCAGGRSVHRLSQRTDEICEQARRKVASFINAPNAQNIIWTKNTTEGINLIAHAFPFSTKRKEVIVLCSEHHSLLLPFYKQSQIKKISLRVVNVKRDGVVNLEKLKKIISKKTALVAVAHSSNTLNVVQPIRAMAALAHSHGAKILVDDAQYIATHQENVQNNDIDLLVFSGHKIGGPTGIGVLYTKHAIQKHLAPFLVGGGTVAQVNLSRQGRLRVRYLSGPRRFEAGIQNYAGIIGLGKAIDVLQSIGYPLITMKTQNLARYFHTQIIRIPEVDIMGRYEQPLQSSLLSFSFKQKKLSLYDFNLFLNESLNRHIIAVRCGHHCAAPIHTYFRRKATMRISFFAYNTKQEIDIFIKALVRYIRRSQGKNK